MGKMEQLEPKYKHGIMSIGSENSPSKFIDVADKVIRENKRGSTIQ